MPSPPMEAARRVVTRRFLGTDDTGGLVALHAGAIVFVVGHIAPNGFIRVSCAEDGKHVDVLALDLFDRSERCAKETTASALNAGRVG